MKILAKLLYQFLLVYLFYLRYGKNIYHSKEIEAIANVLDTECSNSLEILKNLQDKINNRRSSKFNVPSFIYKKLSYKLHKKYKRDN